MGHVAVLLLAISEEGVVAGVAEAAAVEVAGATRAETVAATGTSETDETTLHLSETTVVGSVIGIGVIATETLFAADDHPQVLEDPHLAEISEIVTFK